MKAISAVIATIMLLMITVSLVGVFYVFSATMATTTTASGGEQASQLTAQLSMCMQIDNILGNQVTLRNCGKGVIDNKSLFVTMDDIELDASTQTIAEGNSSIVNISGLWQIPFGKRNLKISNGAAVAQSLVDVQPNKDGLVGSWNFDEGSGTIANDASGNGNVGTLINGPTWADGRFGKGLQFDGVDDYVDAGNAASLNITDAITVAAWAKPITPEGISNYATVVSRNNLLFRTREGAAKRFAFFVKIADVWEPRADWDYIDSNIWYHIDGTYDKNAGVNNLKLYVNGGLKEVQTRTGAINSSTANFIIGSVFNGTIDEVRIWNKSFAPDETVTMKQII